MLSAAVKRRNVKDEAGTIENQKDQDSQTFQPDKQPVSCSSLTEETE